jgi:hypothetical protein
MRTAMLVGEDRHVIIVCYELSRRAARIGGPKCNGVSLLEIIQRE